MDTETKALVQRWILTFCEMPVLIDPELMRRVLDGVEAAEECDEIVSEPAQLRPAA